MLGRREEEVEREEVERQLREVELQERTAQEAEEQERLARLNEIGEIEEGRDLDEDIPDADGEEEAASEEEEDEVDGDELEGEGGDEEGMQDDLDDEIPDADDHDNEDEDDGPLSPAAANGGWVYDTRREPDTDDEDQLSHSLTLPPLGSGGRIHGRHATVAGVHVSRLGSDYDNDEREAEDLADAMLDDNDELFDPHVNRPRPHANHGEHDLDDHVPEAEEDQVWEHTDTELEESEMDISILPGQSQPQNGRSSAAGIPQVSPRTSARTAAAAAANRSSGPWITGPSPAPIQQLSPRQRVSPDATQAHTATIMSASPYPTSSARSASTRAARIVSGNRQRPYRPDLAPARVHPAPRHHLARNLTPGMLDSPLDTEEEVDTDIDDGVDIATPERARPIAQTRIGGGERPQAGRTATMETVRLQGQAQAGPAHANVQNRGNGNGIGSPNRTTAARRWLDGAREAVAGGSGMAGARRTLFQRATRRRHPELDTNADFAATGAGGASEAGVQTSDGRLGASSGGLFSSPTASVQDDGNALTLTRAGEWETPENAAPAANVSEEVSGPGVRRRSGRFLGARRRLGE